MCDIPKNSGLNKNKESVILCLGLKKKQNRFQGSVCSNWRVALRMKRGSASAKIDLVSEGLRPGDNMVDLAGAFDEAFSGLEEWHPGEK